MQLGCGKSEKMVSSTVAMSTVLPYSSLITKRKSPDASSRICLLAEPTNNKSISLSSTFPSHVFIKRNAGFHFHSHLSPKAGFATSPVASSEYAEEPQTKVKFQSSLSLPGCSSSLSLLGTGYREKVFAIIGVKVYAVGFYLNKSIFSQLDAWKGRPSADLQKDSSLFDAIFQTPPEKSVHIILVRDVDGKTFWDALDEAISPRITSPTTVDKSALSTFRSIFQGRPLKKGTSIFLTWLDTTKMLVCVSADGIPSSVDATIESSNVTYALFDVFLGVNPVSPSLKSSASSGLAAVLN